MTENEFQHQPADDAPADEQKPFIDYIVNTTKQFKPQKSHLYWVVCFSYLGSLGIGIGVAFAINIIFNTNSTGLISPYNKSALNLGIPLAIIITFLLSIALPFLLARSKHLLAMFITITLQFITLIIFIIIGLYQLSIQQAPQLVMF